VDSHAGRGMPAPVVNKYTAIVLLNFFILWIKVIPRRILPKFNQCFPVKRYISNKMFVKIRSVVTDGIFLSFPDIFKQNLAVKCILSLSNS